MRTPALLAFLAVSSSALLAADHAPLLAWNFNEGYGDSTLNTGSAGPADLYLLGADGEKAYGFSPAGKGVSGKPGDYAFDLSSAAGMGSTTPNSSGPSGVVWSNSPGLTSLSGLSAFTITGWIKPDVVIGASARIVAAPTFALMAGSSDRLSLQVNGQHSEVQSEPSFNTPGSWIFFAVTYDGTRSVDNITYYVGTPTGGSLTAAGTTTIAAGKLKPFTGQLIVGNNTIKGPITRPFKGLLDNLALYGSQDDASGALTKEKIEAIRAAALR